MQIRTHMRTQKQEMDSFCSSLTCAQGVSSASVQSFIFIALFTPSNNPVTADCEENCFIYSLKTFLCKPFTYNKSNKSTYNNKAFQKE